MTDQAEATAITQGAGDSLRTRLAGHTPLWLALLTAVLVLLATLGVERLYTKDLHREERLQVTAALFQARARLESVINGHLLAIHGLTAVIAAQPDIDQAMFSRIARGLVDQRHALRNIAGAPDLVISLMHPLDGNEVALGLDYRSHPTQRAAALRAMQSGSVVVAGPLPLLQGGIGLVAREPVFLPPATPDGDAIPWGLVSAVMDIDRFYELAGLHAIVRETGLALAMRGRDGQGARGALFYGDAAVFGRDPVMVDVPVPGGSWQIAALPKAGWGQALAGSPFLATLRAIGVAMAAILALMSYLLARNSQRLQRATRRMQRSQELFAGFMHNLPAGAFVHDPQSGRVLFHNHWLRTQPPQLREACAGDCEQNLQALRGGPQLLRHQLQRGDGSPMYCDSLRFLLPSGQHTPLIGSVVMDVTERVLAEQALAEKQFEANFLAELIERSSQPLAVGLSDGRMGRVNQAFLDLLGYSREELGAQDWRRGLTPVKWQQTESAVLQKLMREREPVRYEKEYIRKDGGLVPVELYVHLMQEKPQEPPFYFAFVTDISERKRAAGELAASEARLKEAQRLTHVGSWQMRHADGHLIWSDEVYRIFEIDPQAFAPTYSALIQRIHVDDRALVDQEFRKAVARRRPYHIVHRLQFDDGRIKHVEERGSTEYAEAGDPAFSFGTVQDITERKLAEEHIRQLNQDLEDRVQQRTRELQAANQELETFTYSVSHDLKAPLRGIDGYSRLLLEDHGPQLDGEAHQFLQNIRNGVGQMSQLIEDLLAYSRMERRGLHPTCIDLQTLVDRVLEERVAELSELAAVIRLELGGSCVTADADGLALVMRNLLDNAIKFSRASQPPRISIRAEQKSKHVIIIFSDNGIGFDMCFHDRIFDIFQRLQRAEDYPGTGIGLTIVRKAMQRMDGQVWADSAPGDGARFFLELCACKIN